MIKRSLLILSIIGAAVFVTMALPNPKQDKTITLSLSYQETEIVLKALGKLSLEESLNVYASIQRQITAQVSQQQKPKNETIDSSGGKANKRPDSKAKNN